MAEYYVTPGGNDSTGTGSSGSPFRTPGKAAGVATSVGDIIWTQGGIADYDVVTASPNVAGGVVQLASRVMLRGFGSVAGDDAATPVLRAVGISSATLIAANALSSVIWNVEANGNGLSGIRGIHLATFLAFGYRAVARACTNSGIVLNSSDATALQCRSVGSSAAGAGFLVNSGGRIIACASILGSVSGFEFLGTGTAMNCIAAINSGASSHGFKTARQMGGRGLVAYGNGGSGFFEDFNVDRVHLADIVSYGNARYGTELALGGGSNRFGTIHHGAYGGNSLGTHSNAPYADVGAVSLSANPFDAPAIAALTVSSSLDSIFAAFRPNATAGSGALLRGAGVVPYSDIGAVQSQGTGTAGPTYARDALGRLVDPLDAMGGE